MLESELNAEISTFLKIKYRLKLIEVWLLLNSFLFLEVCEKQNEEQERRNNVNWKTKSRGNKRQRDSKGS